MHFRFIVIAACVLAEATRCADQPQWGSAGSRNMISDERGLPDSFDPATGKNILWRVPLGTETYSTPVVAGGRIFVGTNNERSRDPRRKGDRGVLMCLDTRNGDLRWQLVVPKVTNSIYWDWPRDGLCSPPTVESNHVYLVSNRGEIMCLDIDGLANGNDGPFTDEARHATPATDTPVETGPLDADILWIFDMLRDCGVRQHDSAHASILRRGRFLYVNTSNGVDDSHKVIKSPEAPSLVVVDKQTGKLVATDAEKIGDDIFHSTWSSPATGEVNGRPLIFFCGGNGVVYAFEALPDDFAATTPAPMKKVWQFDFDPDAPKKNIHSYLSNRRESPVNMLDMPVFDGGRIYVSAGGDLWWGKHEAWIKCIDATGTGDVTRTAGRWSHPLTRHGISTASVADGLVYVADCGGMIHCLDAETGAVVWKHEAKGDFWGSTLVADGKVFIGSRRGQFLIFAAGREKKILCDVEMGESIAASPVAANGVLYVATMKSLFAIGADPAVK